MHPKDLSFLLGTKMDAKGKFFGKVATDSREVVPGSMFFALRGNKVDGHAYLADVASRGAAIAVVCIDYQGPHHGMVLIRVPDPLAALQNMATEVLQKRKVKVVAVTGSVGKTTAKEFLTVLLQQKYRVGTSPGNKNSQVGLPVTILNHTTGDEEVLILEMAMTHPGQIAKLVKIAPPDVALITTVSLVHSQNFDSLADIGRAKAEIFSQPKTSLGILHRDIENFDELCKVGASRKISFSTQSLNADYYLEQNPSGLCIKAEGREIRLDDIDVPAKHNRHNFLAAVTAARCVGVSWEEIAVGAKELKLPERRLQTIIKHGITFVNDSYNASEISVKAALSTLPSPERSGRKIAVLAEMPELGKFSEQCHHEVGKYALQCVDKVFCLGNDCEPIRKCWSAAGRPVEIFQTREDLVRSLKEVVKPHDVVLLKGANRCELWKVLDEF